VKGGSAELVIGFPQKVGQIPFRPSCGVFREVPHREATDRQPDHAMSEDGGVDRCRLDRLAIPPPPLAARHAWRNQSQVGAALSAISP
jgi:hypothetical protein